MLGLVFTTTALRDLGWFTKYYEDVFPAGRRNGERQFSATISLLLENPAAGRQSDARKAREFPIGKTPFMIVYKTTKTELQVLRIWDARSKRPESWN